MAFKPLQDTFVYRNLNKEDTLSKNVGMILMNGTALNKGNLEEAFIIINKNFKYPLKNKVIEAVENGEIILMYAPEKVRVPLCLPFILTEKAGKVVAVVFVDMYGKMNPENKTVNVDPKKFYCMMEAALLAKTYYYHYNEISKRNVVVTSGSSIYSNLFTRVLNKKYALNVDKTKMQKVLFLSSKFYMINVLGQADNEMVFNYSVRNCVNGNPYTLKEVNDMLITEDYTDLSTFIQALTKQELGLGLGDLTVRGYMEAFISMYDASALLALESFPYFMYNVIAVTNGAYINNQYILEDIVEKHGAKIYADLLDFNR